MAFKFLVTWQTGLWVNGLQDLSKLTSLGSILEKKLFSNVNPKFLD